MKVVTSDKLLTERNLQLLNQINQIHIKQEEKHMPAQNTYEVKDENETLLEFVERLKSKITELNDQLDKKNETLDTLAVETQELETKNEQLKDAMHKSEQKNLLLASGIEKFEEELEFWIGEVTRLAGEKDSLVKKYNALVKEKAPESEQLRTTTEDFQAERRIRESVTSTRRVNDKHEKEIAELNEEIENLEDKLVRLEKEKEELYALFRKGKISSAGTGKDVIGSIMDKVGGHLQVLRSIDPNNKSEAVLAAVIARDNYMAALARITSEGNDLAKLYGLDKVSAQNKQATIKNRLISR